MATRKRNVEIEIVVDDNQATRSLTKMDRKLDGLERSVNKSGRAFSNFGTAIKTGVGIVGVQAVADFVFGAAQMAEQAGIAADSAEKVLGPALEGLHDNLEGVRGSLGLNIGELDTIVAKFGLLTEGFGLSDDAQADFIENLITTGGELAAFRGNLGDTPEAIDALGAALRGEFDPLEQFGVKLKQSEINERALEIQAADTTGELDDQEAQIAALESLIREKAAPAIGSLAEAQDTLAGKTNEATTRVEDLKIELGEKFQPIAEDFIETVIGMLDVASGDKMPETFAEKLQKDVLDFIATVGDAAAALSDFFGAADLGPSAEAVNDFNRVAGAIGRIATGGSRGGGGSGQERFHSGGVVGRGLAAGTEVPIIAQAGETVMPIGATGGGQTVIHYHPGTTIGNERVLKELLALARRQ